MIEWSGFEPWPGTLNCVLGQDTLRPQWFSPRGKCMCTVVVVVVVFVFFFFGGGGRG